MDLDELFAMIKKILETHASDLDTYDEFINSKAKTKKDSYHLYGKHPVQIDGKTNKVFLAGIIRQKHYVGFYFSPIHSDPEHFSLTDTLQKAKQGKMCFYIKNETQLKELEQLFIEGKTLYKKRGWI